MAIIYRDEGGIVEEELHYNGVYGECIDFCDGFVYFTSAVCDDDGIFIERKISVSALVKIVY